MSEGVTPDLVLMSVMRRIVHADDRDPKLGRFFVNIERPVTFPRLTRVTKTYHRRRLDVEVIWCLDGEPIGTLEAAVDALNAKPMPETSRTEKAGLRLVTDEWQVAPVPAAVLDTLEGKALVESRRENGSTQYQRTDLGRAALID